MIHDERDLNKTISIIAEKVKIVTTKNGARFALINGNRQEISKNKNISILYFINSLGAAAGVFVCGFILIEKLYLMVILKNLPEQLKKYLVSMELNYKTLQT